MMMRPRRGFTLVEVMAAACVLSLGIVLVHQSFLSSLDAFSFTRDYVRVSSAADEMMWDAEYKLAYAHSLQGTPDSGVINVNDRAYGWKLTHESLGESFGQQLWKVEISLARLSGRRRGEISRSSYVLSR